MGYMDDVNKEAAANYGAGGGNSDWFKFENPGTYQMRLLLKPKPIATHFFGKGNPAVVCVGIDEGCPHHKEEDDKPSIKLVTYIIDRGDENKIKMVELPLSVGYAINQLQDDSEYAFSDFPMPYDVRVKYDPKQKDPKAKYTVVAGRKQSEVTEEETAALAEKMKEQTPEGYVANKKKRQKNKMNPSKASEIDYPDADDINPDDIPF